MIVTFGGLVPGKRGGSQGGGGGGGGSAPSWASGLTVDAWTALSVVNNFADVQASDIGQYGNTGPNAVFISWAGAALVTTFGTYGSVLHWNGGHQDYYGNEVYSFDLDTLTWTRLNEPSDQASYASATNGLWPDGTPAVPHTYHFLFARSGTLVTAQRQTSNLPATTNQVSIFNPSTETWSNSTASPSGVQGIDNEGCVYDSSRDGLWLIENDPLSWAFYDFDADTWTAYDSNSSAYSPAGGQVYVPTKDAVILFNSGGPMGLDPTSPSDPGNNEVILTTSGTAPSFTTGDCPRWSANLGAIVYYPDSSNSIYLLTPPAGDWKTGTWAWSQRSLTGTSGTHSGSNGTWGKFNVAEWGEITVALVCGNPSGAYHAVRLG